MINATSYQASLHGTDQHRIGGSHSSLIRTLLLCALLCILCTSTAFAANPAKKTLNAGKTYKTYDITGDGKADKVKFTTGGKQYDAYTKFTVTINGKTAYTLKNTYYYEPIIELYTLQNKKVYVYMKLLTDNDDGVICGIYQYKSGKLKCVYDMTSFFKYGNHTNGVVTGLSGNTMKVKCYVMSWAMGPMEAEFTLKYTDGALKQTSKTGKVSYYDWATETQNGWLTTVQNIPLYKTSTAKSASGSLMKGSKVKVTNVYQSGSKMRLKVKTVTGRIGWIASPTSPMSNSKGLFEERFYAG